MLSGEETRTEGGKGRQVPACEAQSFPSSSKRRTKVSSLCDAECGFPLTSISYRRAKTQKSARWNSDQSESEDEEEESDHESVPDPSEKATSPRRSSSVLSETGQGSNKEEDGGEPSEREKKFGRKARVKAQVSPVQRDERRH